MAEPIDCISPLDGRYATKLSELAPYTSEAALMLARAKIELLWFVHLAEHPEISKDMGVTEAELQKVSGLVAKLNHENAAAIKKIEATTNHDVKAVEYHLHGVLKEIGLKPRSLAFVHFGCTSEDINNLAYNLMMRDALEKAVLPGLEALQGDLKQKAKKYAAIPMLSRTHGQTASPTTVGKELAVFWHRVNRKVKSLRNFKLLGKMNGAVGNFNAHLAAYPDIDWVSLSQSFVEGKLDFSFNPLTTQIENHDAYVECFQALHGINSILIDLSRDIWSYISLGYFTQTLKKGEVGSSTMPHKVNPIDFENGEGNLGMANSMIDFFATKLPISRMQRDLSDSTVLRSTGSIFGYTLLGYQSILKGLGKLALNEGRLNGDLDHAWEVLAEPIQTVMRRYGVDDAYDRLKGATRGRVITAADISEFVKSINEIPDFQKQYLLKLTPQSYLGCAKELVEKYCD